MDERARKNTLLNDIFGIFDLKPMNVVATARRIAGEMGFKRSISRQYLGKLRSGRAEGPTQEKILLLVMTIQELTGYAVRATDLFPLEPAVPEGMPLLRPNGRNASVPISSGSKPGRQTPAGSTEGCMQVPRSLVAVCLCAAIISPNALAAARREQDAPREQQQRETRQRQQKPPKRGWLAQALDDLSNKMSIPPG